MIIKVTQECINLGIQSNCTTCPVAIAIAASIKANDFIKVNGIAVFFHKRDSYFPSGFNTVGYKTAFLPSEAREWIKIFDTDGPLGVSPFEFELDYEVN